MQEKENDDKNLTSVHESEVGEEKVYEIGYLLVPDISEEEVVAIYNKLKDLIAFFVGSVISDESPVKINLAYSMEKTVQNVRNKYDAAYFGWVKFYMDSSKISSLKKKLELDEKIIRFLIIKTVKENTLASKRFTNKDSVRRKNATIKNLDEIVAESAPINKEELDKEIDAMIAEA